MISGGNIDYKGVNPGENPPTPEVFSKWGWTNSDDKLKLTYTLNINQGHTALHNIDIKDQLAFTDGKIKADSVNIHTGTWQVSDEDGAYHLKNTTNVTDVYKRQDKGKVTSSATARSVGFPSRIMSSISIKWDALVTFSIAFIVLLSLSFYPP